MPAEEIIDACIQSKPKILCPSFVYPCDDFRIEKEIKQLKQFLPQHINIIVGGRVAKNYTKFLNESDIKILTDIGEFRRELQEIMNNNHELLNDN